MAVSLPYLLDKISENAIIWIIEKLIGHELTRIHFRIITNKFAQIR